jgi:hypothetical protein
MKIGIDFDNTIIDYGDLFHKYAVQKFNMPTSVIHDKNSVKSYFISLPDGNTMWTELQGIIYGERILEATMFDGLDHFLRHSKKEGVSVSIISHKSEFPALGPKNNLRDAAKRWLQLNGFFDKSCYGLTEASVFFESTIYFKIMRIGIENCMFFIDDLNDIFKQTDFPSEVTKILFSQEKNSIPGLYICNSWKSIEHLIFHNANKQGKT